MLNLSQQPAAGRTLRMCDSALALAEDTRLYSSMCEMVDEEVQYKLHARSINLNLP